MSEFKVELQEFSQLSDAEKMAMPDNGNGKKWANYVRVTYKGQTLYLESDAIEPEDKSFGRNLHWVLTAIRKAYELGRADNGSPSHD
jgi:hypothetical protein